MNRTVPKLKKLKSYISAAQIYDLFCCESESVFLDSSLKGDLGRFSIIGRKPYLRVCQNHGMLFINDKPSQETFEQWMGNYFRTHYRENPTELPLSSGAIGYFTYDYGRKYEHVESRHTDRFVCRKHIFVFMMNLSLRIWKGRRHGLSKMGRRKTARLRWKNWKN